MCKETELAELKLQKLKLTNKAFKQFPSSPLQKSTIIRIDALTIKINELEAK